MGAKSNRGRPKGSVNRCRGVKSLTKQFYQFSNSIHDKEKAKSNLLFCEILSKVSEKSKMKIEDRTRLLNLRSLTIKKKNL